MLDKKTESARIKSLEDPSSEGSDLFSLNIKINYKINNSFDTKKSVQHDPALPITSFSVNRRISRPLSDFGVKQNPLKLSSVFVKFTSHQTRQSQWIRFLPKCLDKIENELLQPGLRDSSMILILQDLELRIS